MNLDDSEELYGAVMQALTSAERFSEAHELFKLMERGTFGLKPGLSCYNALLLSHVKLREWTAVIDTFEKMKCEGVPPSSSTLQGLLIAAYRSGGRSKVITTLKELLSSRAKMDRITFELVANMLLPELGGSTEEMRKKLRKFGEQRHWLRPASMHLARSIRIAEVEQQRPVPDNRERELSEKVADSWNLVMHHLIEYVDVSNQEPKQNSLQS